MLRCTLPNGSRMAIGIAAFLVLAGLGMTPGCGDRDKAAKPAPTGNSADPASAPVQYPASLSAESSPKEVAAALVKALDSGDSATLLGLVALKDATQEVKAIYERHGRSSKMTPDSVARLTAAGWRATYAFLQKSQTVVEREEAGTNSARVFCAGRSKDGKRRVIRIDMVREDGLWKVRAGLRNLPG